MTALPELEEDLISTFFLVSGIPREETSQSLNLLKRANLLNIPKIHNENGAFHYE
jgi:hypothetical protein